MVDEHVGISARVPRGVEHVADQWHDRPPPEFGEREPITGQNTADFR